MRFHPCLVLLGLTLAYALPDPRGVEPLVPDVEFRALFLATAWNIDWPSSGSASPATQQQELITYLNMMQNANFNVLHMQVRLNDIERIKSRFSFFLSGSTSFRCFLPVKQGSMESLLDRYPRYCSKSSVGPAVLCHHRSSQQRN